MNIRIPHILWWILVPLVFLTIVFSTGQYGIVLIFIMLGLVAVGALVSIVEQLWSFGRSRSWGKLKNVPLFKLIAKFSLLFLTTGTFIYILTFLAIEKENLFQESEVFFSNTELFIRSLICSFDLFLLDIDSNIIDRIDHRPELKTWIFIQAILSALTTAVMFLSLVITRLRALWILNHNTSVTNEKSHLYLFFGLSPSTGLLAKDIREKDPAAIVIVIDRANISDEDKGSLENILSFIGHKASSFSFADNIQAVIAVSNKSLAEINFDKEQTTGDVFSELGLPRIKKLMQQLNHPEIESGQLHIFILGEDEERNVADLINLAKDTTLLQLSNGRVQPTIYCHARMGGPNIYLEELGWGKKLRVRIIDSSYISVERLKLEEKFHPVNQVVLSEKNPGTVASSLNCLIIGFGEVGRDALRFIYEFGAFVDEKANEDNSFRSPFSCLVVDPEMDKLKGGFLQTAPVLAEANSGVKFMATSSGDSEFFSKVLTENYSKALNYIVIATGDDNENIDVAVKIFNHLRSSGHTMQRLRIMVRCSTSNRLEKLRKLATFYNQAQNPENPMEIITIFGEPESVFSYDIIVGDVIECDAKRFFAQYQIESRENNTWEGRREKLTRPPLSLDHLRELSRKEGQDRENALHASTKIHILRGALGSESEFKNFCSRYFLPDGLPNHTGSGKEIVYPGLTKEENRIVLNLAMLEHLRWNASHELAGYRRCAPGETSCNEKFRTHNCLVPWQELDTVSKEASKPDWRADYKKYDFFVVDTSVSLFNRKN